MDNAHRENVKNLFRWWNGHVFSFGMPGVNRTDDDGFDSGMDEAEAALNSNKEFDSKGRSDDHNSWYVSNQHPADRPPLQMNTNTRPNDLSIDFVHLTISEHSLEASPGPSNPVAAPVHAIAVSRVHEPTLVHFAGQQVRLV